MEITVVPERTLTKSQTDQESIHWEEVAFEMRLQSLQFEQEATVVADRLG